METGFKIPQKLKLEIPLNLLIIILCISPEQLEKSYQNDTCILMFFNNTT